MKTLPGRIVIDAAVCGGRPHFKGTRIPVYVVLEMLANQETWADVHADYPLLTQDDIHSAWSMPVTSRTCLDNPPCSAGMRVILDNNLPRRMAKSLQGLAPGCDVCHLSDLECRLRDGEIRRRLGGESIVWITRDEDFWLDAPASWAIVWVACHNPRLAFLRESLAPAIARHLPDLVPGSRLLATEDVVTLI